MKKVVLLSVLISASGASAMSDRTKDAVKLRLELLEWRQKELPRSELRFREAREKWLNQLRDTHQRLGHEFQDMYQKMQTGGIIPISFSNDCYRSGDGGYRTRFKNYSDDRE
jgi:hypothetical protein